MTIIICKMMMDVIIFEFLRCKHTEKKRKQTFKTYTDIVFDNAQCDRMLRMKFRAQVFIRSHFPR